jgi:hypothetical protein
MQKHHRAFALADVSSGGSEHHWKSTRDPILWEIGSERMQAAG